jgi:hypothetical protein
MIGKSLICVKPTYGLIEGKRYEVIAHEKGTSFVSVRDDEGNTFGVGNKISGPTIDVARFRLER